jgi:hypothetical protein
MKKQNKLPFFNEAIVLGGYWRDTRVEKLGNARDYYYQRYQTLYIGMRLCGKKTKPK